MRNSRCSARATVGALPPIRDPRTGAPIDVDSVFRFVDETLTAQTIQDYRLVHSGTDDPPYNLALTPEQILELAQRYTKNNAVDRKNKVADAIRCLLAENPNASGEALLLLNPFCPYFVQKNLALPLVLIEDPVAGMELSPALYELVFQQAPTMTEDLTRIASLAKSGITKDQMEKLASKFVRHSGGRDGERIAQASRHLSGLWMWYTAFSPSAPRYILLRRASIAKLLSRKGPITPDDCLSSQDASKSKANPPGQPEIVAGTKILVVWSESVAKGLLNGMQRGSSTGDEIFVPMKLEASIDELQPLTHDGNVRAPLGYEVAHLWAALRETDLSRRRIDLSGFKDSKGKAPKPAQASSSSRTFDITRSIREDVKKFTALPENKGLVTSVTGDHNSIRIKIKALPYSILSMYELPLFLRMTANNWGQYDRMKAALNPQYPALLKSLHAIMDKYHWDKSDLQAEYHNSNFYKNVDLDWNVEGVEKEKLRMELLAYVSNPQIRPQELVHVSNIFRFEGHYLPFQDKKPFMVAIGSNPQVAKLSPAEYKEVEEWIGTNLVVPRKTPSRLQARINLPPRKGKKPGRPAPDARPHTGPRSVKPPSMPARNQELPAGSQSSALVLAKPAKIKHPPRLRQTRTPEEKAARREELRESREPLLLRRKDGPFLIMGVPAQRGRIGAVEQAATDQLACWSFHRLLSQQIQREIVGQTACRLITMTDAKLAQKWCAAITDATTRTDLSPTTLQDLSSMIEEAIGTRIMNLPSVERNPAPSVLREARYLTRLAITAPISNAVPLAEAGFDLTGERVVTLNSGTIVNGSEILSQEFYRRMQVLAAEYDATFAREDLPRLQGSPRDVMMATIIRAQSIEALDEFGRIDWEITEDDQEMIEVCRAEIGQITSAADWVKIFAYERWSNGPLQVLVDDLDGTGGTNPDSVLRGWNLLGDEQRQRRVATTYVGHARRR